MSPLMDTPIVETVISCWQSTLAALAGVALGGWAWWLARRDQRRTR